MHVCVCVYLFVYVCICVRVCVCVYACVWPVSWGNQCFFTQCSSIREREHHSISPIQSSLVWSGLVCSGASCIKIDLVLDLNVTLSLTCYRHFHRQFTCCIKLYYE